jgi:hypothetical protein
MARIALISKPCGENDAGEEERFQLNKCGGAPTTPGDNSRRNNTRGDNTRCVRSGASGTAFLIGMMRADALYS